MKNIGIVRGRFTEEFNNEIHWLYRNNSYNMEAKLLYRDLVTDIMGLRRAHYDVEKTMKSIVRGMNGKAKD